MTLKIVSGEIKEKDKDKIATVELAELTKKAKKAEEKEKKKKLIW